MDILEMVSGDGKAEQPNSDLKRERERQRDRERESCIALAMRSILTRSSLSILGNRYQSSAKAYHAYHWMSSWPGSHCGDFDTFHRSVSSSMIVREYSTEFHEYAVERPAWFFLSGPSPCLLSSGPLMASDMPSTASQLESPSGIHCLQCKS